MRRWCGVCARRRGDRRQDQHDRIRLFRHRRQSALRHAGQSGRPRARARRLVVGRRAWRRPTACARSPSAATPAARCAFRPRSAAWSASSRAGSAFRPTASFRCRTASTRSGRSRARVADCAKADAVMAGDEFEPLEPAPLAGLRIGIAQGMPLENLDETVAKRFPEAIDRLERAGARLSNEKLPLLDGWRGSTPRRRTAGGSLYRASRPARPAWRRHRSERARAAGARAQHRRRRLYRDGERTRRLDPRPWMRGLPISTCWCCRPRRSWRRTMDEVAAPDNFGAQERPAAAQHLDRGISSICCAISLPLPREGGLPTGLMLVVRNGHDHRLFRIAAAVERLLG